MSGNPSRVVKVSLAEELVVFLEIQAEAEGLHPADLVNRAVAREKYFQEVKDRGGKILVEEKDGAIFRLLEK
jgi:hypothetical protein